jgi:hypothetical protein
VLNRELAARWLGLIGSSGITIRCRSPLSCNHLTTRSLAASPHIRKPRGSEDVGIEITPEVGEQVDDVGIGVSTDRCVDVRQGRCQIERRSMGSPQRLLACSAKSVALRRASPVDIPGYDFFTGVPPGGSAAATAFAFLFSIARRLLSGRLS